MTKKKSPYVVMSAWLVLLAFCLSCSLPARAELQPEPIPNVLTLPKQYPDTWLYAHDTNFFSLVDGKVVVLDLAAENRQYKGQIGAGQFPSFIESTKRSELYVAETFYSRRIRGERTDTVTIYDKENLAPIGEILLPGGKRGQTVTLKHSLQLLNDEKFLLVFNFSPAVSVTVIDIIKREIIAETPIPGCSMIYPTGKRGFSSLCSDGSMLTTHLKKDGTLKKQERHKVFFDVEADPLFTKTGTIKGVTYFPSFKGQVQPVDFSGSNPVVKPGWSLVSKEEAAKNWRPGGWQVVTAHPGGLLYMLMHQDGYNGSHKDGGSEVWVFDVNTQKRVKRITLSNWGVSIEVTRGKQSYLAVTNANFDIDVYDAREGKFLRTIGGRAAETPFALHAVK